MNLVCATAHFLPASAEFVAVPSPLVGEGYSDIQRGMLGERLSCESSALPSSVVSNHGIENGEQLASCGDEGDHFGFTQGTEMLEEGA